MAKDLYHDLVKAALIKDGWKITDDPYIVNSTPRWQIDLGAEKAIGAEKNDVKIVVEVKSFLKPSFPHEFHAALGQYLNYALGLRLTHDNRILYLAVPLGIWDTGFQIEGIKAALEYYKINVVIFDTNTETILQWIISN